MTEIPVTVQIRKHRVDDIMRQVEQGYPDSLPAYIPAGLRNANEIAVNAIIKGAKVKVIKDKPDIFCDGCDLKPNCDYKDDKK